MIIIYEVEWDETQLQNDCDQFRSHFFALLLLYSTFWLCEERLEDDIDIYHFWGFMRSRPTTALDTVPLGCDRWDLYRLDSAARRAGQP